MVDAVFLRKPQFSLTNRQIHMNFQLIPSVYYNWVYMNVCVLWMCVSLCLSMYTRKPSLHWKSCACLCIQHNELWVRSVILPKAESVWSRNDQTRAIDALSAYVGPGRVWLCAATLVPPLAELRYGPTNYAWVFKFQIESCRAPFGVSRQCVVRGISAMCHPR